MGTAHMTILPCTTTMTIRTIAIKPTGGAVSMATRTAMLMTRGITSTRICRMTMRIWMTTMTMICGEFRSRRLHSFSFPLLFPAIQLSRPFFCYPWKYPRICRSRLFLDLVHKPCSPCFISFIFLLRCCFRSP